jgi:hypothetical protein
MQNAYRIMTAKKINEIIDINRHNIIHKRQQESATGDYTKHTTATGHMV